MSDKSLDGREIDNATPEQMREELDKYFAHVQQHGLCSATADAAQVHGDEPLIDLKSGYVQRADTQFPRQGDVSPWRMHQNYLRDVALLRRGTLDDGVLRFS